MKYYDKYSLSYPPDISNALVMRRENGEIKHESTCKPPTNTCNDEVQRNVDKEKTNSVEYNKFRKTKSLRKRTTAFMKTKL